ncbi:bifunctional UDP-sugar hydrolase/5'-nucleotidase [Paenibacillus tarimensis]
MSGGHTTLYSGDQHLPRVVLLHSNDIHSRLERTSQIASFISEQRRVYGDDRLLVVDCGDHMDRMRLETEGSNGRVNIELMNAACYTAAAIGNNEGLTYRKETLGRVYETYAQFPVICANLFDAKTGQRPDWMLPRLITRKNGMTFGITSVTFQYESFYRLLGWQVTDPLMAAAEQVGWMRSRVDVVVVLSHLGLPMDERMAMEIKGIDVIAGGHTHHLLYEPIRISDTIVCAAGKFGDHLGKIEIDWNSSTDKPVLRASCVSVADYAEEPESNEIIKRYRASGERRLSRVVARLDEPLPVRLEGESPLGNLLAAGLRRWTDAEIGIVNTGQLLGGLAKGDVTEGQLHALCPSPINPCRMQLSGRQIRTALEESLLDEFIGMPIRGYGFRGHRLGALAIDGIEVVYDPDQLDYHKIISITIQGEELTDDKDYIVGTIDMFTFGAGYKSLRQGMDIQYYLPEFIRNVLASQLTDRSFVLDCFRNRWSVLKS